MAKGHHESSGCCWEPGEIPECDQCGKQAIWETAISGVYLCDNPQCHSAHIRENSEEIEFVEEEQ